MIIGGVGPREKVHAHGHMIARVRAHRGVVGITAALLLQPFGVLREVGGVYEPVVVEFDQVFKAFLILRFVRHKRDLVVDPG